MGVAPFAHSRGRQEGFLEQFLVLIAAQGFALRIRPLPQFHKEQEIRFLVGERLVGLISLLLLIVGAFPGILGGQCGHHNQGLAQHFLFCRRDQHSAQGGVQRETCQLPPQCCQRLLLCQRAQLIQQPVTIADQPAIRWFDKGKIFDPAQAQVCHLQNHRPQIGALNFRVGERRPIEKIVFVKQAETDTRHYAAATAGPLIGTGLTHRLHRQALHLGVHAITADTRGTGIDHIANAGHRE